MNGGYLAFIQQLLVFMVPVAAMLTVYAWSIVWRYRNRHVKLPVILALMVTISGACTTVLSWAVLNVLPLTMLWIVSTAVLIQNFVPLLAVAYLAFLDVAGIVGRRREDGEGRD